MERKTNKVLVALIVIMAINTVVNYILVYNLVTMQGHTMQFISDVMMSQTLHESRDESLPVDEHAGHDHTQEEGEQDGTQD